MRVTPAQEEVLVKWLEDLQRQVLPLNHGTLGKLVVQLLHENDDINLLDSTGLLGFFNDIHLYKQVMEDPWTFSGFYLLIPTSLQSISTRWQSSAINMGSNLTIYGT